MRRSRNGPSRWWCGARAKTWTHCRGTFSTTRFGRISPVSRHRSGRSCVTSRSRPASRWRWASGDRLDSGRASLVFSGDTGPCDSLWRAVNQIENLAHVIVETSYGDEQQWIAEASGHLCPRLLAEELQKLERPAEIMLTHMKPGAQETIMREVAARTWRSQPRQLKRGQVIEL